MDYLMLGIGILLLILLILVLLKLSKPVKEMNFTDDFRRLEQGMVSLEERQKMLNDKVNEDFARLLGAMSENNMQGEQKLDNLRRTLTENLEKMQSDNNIQLEKIRITVDEKLQDTLEKKLTDSFKLVSERLGQGMISIEESQKILNNKVNEDFVRLVGAMSENNMQSEQKLDNLRRTLTESIGKMQSDNNTQLEKIRITVDEKLQDTLDKKLTDSFKLVSERLEQVYKGLGEMQTVANSVGDLKRVLSNVKTRGILGEVQLGAILEQILTPDQYGKNVATKKGSQANVEYAVKLPGEKDNPVWLPIDAKFPADAYAQLTDAYELADSTAIEVATKQLRDRLRSFAKDIKDKYISPPNTTDFAIMFLPVEGLYAEAVRMGLIETLQNDYKINIAGPTTMAALLNSLQMGFKTLAIQKRSSEVWDVLGAVKGEFENFASVLTSAQKRINQANEDLDKLIGTRTRKIQSTLKAVQSMPVGLDEYIGEDENANV